MGKGLLDDLQRGAMRVSQPAKSTYFLVGMKAGMKRGCMTGKLVFSRATTLFFPFNV